MSIAEQKAYHKGDLVRFGAEIAIRRRAIEILDIRSGFVKICDPIPEWLTPEEFQAKDPVVVGYVKRGWFGQKKYVFSERFERAGT